MLWRGTLKLTSSRSFGAMRIWRQLMRVMRRCSLALEEALGNLSSSVQKRHRPSPLLLLPSPLLDAAQL